MADSSQLRSRRSRRHKAGDHSLCRPERCSAFSPEGDGEIERALRRYLHGLDLPDDDPRKLIAAVALKLARSSDAHMTASLARELRGCVTDLAALETDDDGRAAARRMLADLKELTE